MFHTFSETTKANLAALISRAQAITVTAILILLMVVVVLSTVHLGYLIVQQMSERPRFLIPVQGLLEVFGYFLLVLIGVELLETVKMYLKKDVIHVRVVIEVALIAMARKAITEEPASVPSMTLFGVAAMILALAVASFFQRDTPDFQRDTPEQGKHRQ